MTGISYSIGGATLANVGSYIFGEDPVCNYPETVTLTDLPTFVTHNGPTSDDFTVPQTNDLTLIGSYPVTIRSEICVPDDHTQASCTPLFSEYEFTVLMEPCIVIAYRAMKKVTSIVYNVNQATLTDGRYVFDEDPVCGYPETVTVTNLPSFATHNELSSDFTIR